MRRITKMLWLASLFLFVMVSVAQSAPATATQETSEATPETVLVGRTAHVEGELLRYVPDIQDWVAVVTDAPFGLDDALYSGESARAEFVMPNQTRIRIGETTQIQLITLTDVLTEVDVASGMARLQNNSDNAVVKVTTPFGHVVAGEDTSFDLYVGDESVEVVSLRGTVDFVHEKGTERYGVVAGSPSVIADSTRVVEGEDTVDAQWHAWNEQRDQIWTKRVQVRGESVKYLPKGLHDESHVLEENGRWERVRYQGQYHNMWRPTGVEPDWRPFTAGRWTDYHGDQTWVPHEPFGYLTHHYGNWMYLDHPGAWYWAPPTPHYYPRRPTLSIGFSWYPGRVAWLHSGHHIGWIPLAPHEPYFARRYWGPRTRVVRNVTNINVNVNRFRHVDHAIFVGQDRFYGVDNYRTVRIRDINRARLARDFRVVPFVGDNIVVADRRQRFRFRNVDVDRLPHPVVLERVERNRRLAARDARAREREIRQLLATTRQGTLVRDAQIDQPRVSNRLVRRDEIDRPRADVRFEQRQLRREARQIQRAQQREERAERRQERAENRLERIDERLRRREAMQARRAERDADAAQRRIERRERQRIERRADQDQVRERVRERDRQRITPQERREQRQQLRLERRADQDQARERIRQRDRVRITPQERREQRQQLRIERRGDQDRARERVRERDRQRLTPQERRQQRQQMRTERRADRDQAGERARQRNVRREARQARQQERAERRALQSEARVQQRAAPQRIQRQDVRPRAQAERRQLRAQQRDERRLQRQLRQDSRRQVRQQRRQQRQTQRQQRRAARGLQSFNMQQVVDMNSKVA